MQVKRCLPFSSAQGWASAWLALRNAGVATPSQRTRDEDCVLFKSNGYRTCNRGYRLGPVLAGGAGKGRSCPFAPQNLRADRAALCFGVGCLRGSDAASDNGRQHLETPAKPRLSARGARPGSRKRRLLMKRPGLAVSPVGTNGPRSPQDARPPTHGGLCATIDSTDPTIVAATSIVSLRGVLALPKYINLGPYAVPKKGATT